MRLLDPDYLLQPRAIVRRVRRPPVPAGRGEEITVSAGTGLPLRVRTDESIGYSIATTGVFDLPVTETLLRLADPGETAVDVGANIGCMASALAAAVGHRGRVIAFEPNPAVLPLLRASTRVWDVCVELHETAVSDAAGHVDLIAPAVGGHNQGLARIGRDAGTTDRLHRVQAVRLDDLLAGQTIGVMKIDVEDHEPQVLAGAERLLAEHRVRDVVFEDRNAYPGAASRLLEAAGYQVFAIGRTFFSPRLYPPERLTAGDEGQSYLATLDPDRALSRFKRRGWLALGR
jgi:FkbM family methyltransferase